MAADAGNAEGAFPPGTRYWDVDGTPVAARPGEPPKAYDREPARWADPTDVWSNGVAIDRAEFLTMVEAARR